MKNLNRLGVCFLTFALPLSTVWSSQNFDRLAQGAQLISDNVSSPQNVPPHVKQLRTRLLQRPGRKYPWILLQDQLDAAGTVLQQNACVADHLIVKIKDAVLPAQFTQWCNQQGLPVVKQLRSARQILLVRAPQAGELGLQTLQARLNASGLVETATLDYLVSASAIPNDPRFSELYGLQNTGQAGGTADADIDAPEAWDLTKGDSNLVVGVVDSGIDRQHPDLAANIWTNQGESGALASNGIDDDSNGYIDDTYGWDFLNEDNNPMDDNNHGTHVSGTIGAVGNNSTGTTGVCWQVKLLGLKFLGADNFGSYSDAIEAYNYAIRLKRDRGINIVALNNSWGGGYRDPILEQAIESAYQQGILTVAAAHNYSSNIETSPMYPAGYPSDGVISVAATDEFDQLASYSNYGAVSVDLAAPGSNIWSSTPNNTCSLFSGTSMATPHVSGVCALLKAYKPGLTASELRMNLLASVDPLPSLAGKTVTGGRLNAFKALQRTQQAQGQGTGLDAVYYDNKDFTGTTVRKVDSSINFDWPMAPVTGIAPDTFSVRWTGSIQSADGGAIQFGTWSDDGVRVWIGGIQVINNWTDHSSTWNESTPVTFLAGEKKTIIVEFFDNGAEAVCKLQWKKSGQAWTAVPSTALFSQSTPSGIGLDAVYFDNEDLTGSSTTKIDPLVDFNWGAGAPLAGFGQDTFSARWSGKVQAVESGAYQFATWSDDGIRVWVGGSQLINNWTNHGTTWNESSALNFTSGEKKEIKVEYYESGDGAICRLLWKRPGRDWEIVPQTALFPVDGTGLSAVYYDNKDFTGPTVSRVDSKVDFDWGDGIPVTGIGADSFTVRWRGTVRAIEGGSCQFGSWSDDGICIWVGGTQMVSNWTDHGATWNESGGITLAAGESRVVTVEFYENGGGAMCGLYWKRPGRAWEVVPQSALLPVVPSGLSVTYFDNKDFTGTAVTRVDSTVDYNWGNSAPAGLGPDTFSARWFGSVKVVTAGVYQFRTWSDDGVRLRVGGVTVIDNWTDHGATWNESSGVTFAAGEAKQITLEYYENGADAACRLEWKPPGGNWQLVPQSALSPTP